MLKTILISSAVCTCAGTAIAGDICKGGPRDQWLGEPEIVERMNALGHVDFELSIEDGCIAVEVETPEEEIEYFFEPITGDLATIKKS